MAAAGAVLGAIVWARWPGDPHWRAALATLLALTAAGQLLGAATGAGLLGAAVVLVFSTLLGAPGFVVALTAADALVPPSRRTEASTWVSTASNAGSTAGTAVGGLAVTWSSAPLAWAGALALGAVVVLAATRSRRFQL